MRDRMRSILTEKQNYMLMKLEHCQKKQQQQQKVRT